MWRIVTALTVFFAGSIHGYSLFDAAVQNHANNSHIFGTPEHQYVVAKTDAFVGNAAKAGGVPTFWRALIASPTYEMDLDKCRQASGDHGFFWANVAAINVEGHASQNAWNHPLKGALLAQKYGYTAGGMVAKGLQTQALKCLAVTEQRAEITNLAGPFVGLVSEMLSELPPQLDANGTLDIAAWEAANKVQCGKPSCHYKQASIDWSPVLEATDHPLVPSVPNYLGLLVNNPANTAYVKLDDTPARVQVNGETSCSTKKMFNSRKVETSCVVPERESFYGNMRIVSAWSVDRNLWDTNPKMATLHTSSSKTDEEFIAALDTAYGMFHCDDEGVQVPFTDFATFRLFVQKMVKLAYFKKKKTACMNGSTLKKYIGSMVGKKKDGIGGVVEQLGFTPEDAETWVHYHNRLLTHVTNGANGLHLMEELYWPYSMFFPKLFFQLILFACILYVPYWLMKNRRPEFTTHAHRFENLN